MSISIFVLDWFTKNELRHLFIHGTKRTLECNKRSVEYLQHFCHVLRFAPTLRFTLWFVHKTFEVVKSVPVIIINKICKKIVRIQIKASWWLGNPHLAFQIKIDSKFVPTMWFLKRKLHSITVCEIGSETTASTAHEKRKTLPPLRQYTFMHQSIPPAPSPPPGYCGEFARLVSTGGRAFANFALPGSRAFVNPRAIPQLLTRTQFPIRI